MCFLCENLRREILKASFWGDDGRNYNPWP